MFLAILLFMVLPAVFSNLLLALPAFLLLSIVLYAWFANKFFIKAFVQRTVFTKKQKDWLQVNAIVTSIVSAIWFFSAFSAYTHPTPLKEAVEVQMPAELQNKITIQTVKNIGIGLMSICVLLLTHVIWTISLLRKYLEHLKNVSEESDMDN
ncbi:hypothetical protein FLA_4818 [Filimonas lacunae]|nr:hypothetical protein FLA_4818 [Filimonas lacunae]